ncbi:MULTISPECIES: glycosyltransferase [unclassified Aureimonas]|uniref:glycosyltransferase n=1 Tax=unclassified Aureimonas TaxID=2615206 RepID=UPI0006FCC125|nr:MULTISPECIES: glycosyltransferase [unclassified Aureimonas]KQT68933.1 hypothetical protein ASG54_04525 [Aureimonas sp. Leaf460]KQT69160.1 hypothetical protein ASG62_17130 [Aureimonas sp. Leaf427]
MPPSETGPNVLGLPEVEAIDISGEPSRLAACALVACVPAQNEEGWIARCLAALDAELWPGEGVLLLANGCTDATIAIARAVTAGWTRPFLLVDCRWRPGEGSAPLARRITFDMAEALAPDALILSIDGDTVVLPGLRAAYAAEFERGFDLVCGRIGFLPEEAALLPHADPGSEAVIRDYRETTREIAALLRPDPDNPWPHHGNIGGANFAMRAAAYRIAGPLPILPSGEDRALRRRFEAHGRRIRYCDGARVETSCRLEGRAAGGLSEELRRNRTQTDPLVDELLEPAETLLLRLRAEAAFLAAPLAEDRARILTRLGLAAGEAARLAETVGGLGWHAAEEASPALRRTRLRLSDLRRLLPGLQAARDAIREARSGSPA